MHGGASDVQIVDAVKGLCLQPNCILSQLYEQTNRGFEIHIKTHIQCKTTGATVNNYVSTPNLNRAK